MAEETEQQDDKSKETVIEIPNGNSMIAEKPETKIAITEENRLSIEEPESDDQGDFISRIGNRIRKWKNKNKKWIKYVAMAIIFVLYNTYLGFAIHLTWNDPPKWNRGVRSLLLFTIFVYFMILYYTVLKKYVIKPALYGFYHIKCVNIVLNWKYFPWLIWALIVLGLTIFLIIDSANNRYRLLSFSGLFVLILFGYLFSAHRKHIIWRQTLWGCLLQFIFGVMVLRWDTGREILETFANKVDVFLGYTDYGSKFVFDYLATGELKDLPKQNTIFAFKVLPVVLFFSFFTSILYYYGIMQILVLKVGWFLHKTIKTTACESVTAAANIFLGLIETPLLIKPFIGFMTKSEIHAVMTGGFATIAGGVMAAYISFGVNATHLLSASVMSAPAALSFAKLFYPETEETKTSIKHIKVEKGTEKNVLEAAVNGVTSAVNIVVNMAVNMIAFLAFVNFLDGTISWFGSLLGYEYITFDWIVSKCFIPISIIMGIEWKDAEHVANLVGIKTIVNEFVAYQKLGELKKANKISKRSEYIATYALCGFSNISAIGIQMGALIAIAQNKKSDIATVSVRALIAGSFACFMTACIAV
ncbi:solute carrier family 28 member 3-like isoform X2 [Centruroides sculpturatus]|uniref:solute carrier family 28 member 3-like isoform X2 n=1 Tax=Centruroides sculpturatus TaxID=218467 RepID=UPI000C6DA83D|nr:solute carrier family 28 member 3-like isoform X2 [Centruroides sculpturatus]